MQAKHLNTIVAACDEALEETLVKNMPNINVLSTVRDQSSLFNSLEEDAEETNVIFLKETLPGNYLIGQVVKNIKENYPDIRIIFIMVSTNDEEVSKLKTYLYSKQVYDILYDEAYDIDDVSRAMFSPKKFKDITKEMKNVPFEEELKSFENNETESDDEKDIPKEDIKLNYNNNIYSESPAPKAIAFWSPKGGSGIDTLAIITGACIAKNTNIPVCIADFSEIPNAQLFFNVSDSMKSMENAYEAQSSGKLNSYTLDNYLIGYEEMPCKITNLHILPGAINKINFYRRIMEDDGGQEVLKNFCDIIGYLKEKFRVVILILSSDIYHVPTVAGLSKANQINMILENNLCSIYNTQRFIDDKYGILNRFSIDKSKMKFILNKDYIKDMFYIDKYKSFAGFEFDARMPLVPDEIYDMIKHQDPSRIFDANEVCRKGILSVINTIMKMEYNGEVESKTEGKAREKKKEGLFKKIFKKLFK